MSRSRRRLRIVLESVLLLASVAGAAYLGQRALSEGLTTRPLPDVTPSVAPVLTP